MRISTDQEAGVSAVFGYVLVGLPHGLRIDAL
jgi:hypothetical protein